jgi:tetratricopeptide (TPR) repeat protein
VVTRGRDRHEPIVLETIPSWMRVLAGADVVRAEARAEGSRVRLRAVTAAGATLWELQDGPALACVRLDARTRPPRRVPIPVPANHVAEITRFLRRVAWLQDPEGRPRTTTPPDDARLRALSDALYAVRDPDDADRVPLDETDRADPARSPVALLLDACAGRWAHVFAATDAGVQDARGWAGLLLTALSGDVEALQALAASPTREVGARALIEAATLALAGLPDAALARHRAAGARHPGFRLPDADLEIAKLARERGQLDVAIEHARRALLARPDDDAHRLAVTRELVRCGAPDDAHAVLAERCGQEPFAPEPALALAELLLSAGRPAEARRWLAPLLGDASDLRVRRAEGVTLALEARWEEALVAFERARAVAPRDMETLAWLAEASLRLGRRDDAAHFVTASRLRVQTAVHTLLGGALTPRARIPHEHGLLRLLDALGEPHDPWHADPTRAALAVLDSFGGHRGESLTRRVAGAPGLGIAPLRLPREDAHLSSRDAAADALRALGELPLAALERRFGHLAAAYPDSPHPLCFRGELDLWLGEPHRAITRFDAALARAPARWAYVGRAAAEILLGEWAAADATLTACDAQFAPIPGATTHVYVGEMWRRRGEHARAIHELRIAVAAKPGRIAAWMNLALSLTASGEREEARRIFIDVAERAPRLLWDASRALGQPAGWPPPGAQMEALFEAALTMMRGNRSSHTLTYFDAEGRLRIVRPVAAWRALLAHHAATLGGALRSDLATGA